MKSKKMKTYEEYEREYKWLLTHHNFDKNFYITFRAWCDCGFRVDDEDFITNLSDEKGNEILESVYAECSADDMVKFAKALECVIQTMEEDMKAAEWADKLFHAPLHLISASENKVEYEIDFDDFDDKQITITKAEFEREVARRMRHDRNLRHE